MVNFEGQESHEVQGHLKPKLDLMPCEGIVLHPVGSSIFSSLFRPVSFRYRSFLVRGPCGR